ncbi:colicin transporter [Trinickia sp.]|uniref:colicin transporter n=1 Tax=Trinickia sp. TaxID=2571163 RepID=UPI003F7E71E5
MFRSPPTTLLITRFIVALRGAVLAVAACACPLGMSGVAFAQDVPATPAEAVGAGGAAPAQAADFDARQRALDTRTAENDYVYGVAVHDCYSKFFVNACLGRARDKMRAVRGQIHAEQLALDDERRSAHAQQRDEQEALRRARDAQEAPQRAAAEARSTQAFEDKQRQHALDQAQRNGEAPQHAADQAAYDRKQADFQRKLDQARQNAAQDAKERAERAQRYEQKQMDAKQHKADVEARQKQAAQKAQEKQQEQMQQQEQQKRSQQEQDSD